jgi:two-component system sensor histidine kinase HydH
VRTGIYTPPGGFPELEVRVEDAGPGLPANLGDQIFEAFVTTKESGLGLGLSICRRIVESHAGSLRAEPRNANGGGATFVLRLPVLAPPAPGA